MTLEDVILNCNDYKELNFVYVKRISGKFLSNSEAIVLELKDEELEMDTNEISKIKCPEFSYFLEMFLIQEMVNDLKLNRTSNKDIVDRVIYYAENDA